MAMEYQLIKIKKCPIATLLAVLILITLKLQIEKFRGRHRRTKSDVIHHLFMQIYTNTSTKYNNYIAIIQFCTHRHTYQHASYLWKGLGTCHWFSSSSTSKAWTVFLLKTVCLAVVAMHGNSVYWPHCPPPYHSWPEMRIYPTHQLKGDTHAEI